MRHPRPPARRRGAILIVVLITGTALLLVALAGSTLALLHLGSARYAERAQRARIVARSGLQLADAALARHVREAGQLPMEPPTLPGGHGLDLRVVGYRRLGDGSAEIEIEGRSEGASATAGARLEYP